MMGDVNMADVITIVLQILVLIVLVVNTVMTMRAFRQTNGFISILSGDIKKLGEITREQEPEVCKKCGKPIDDHTIGEAKKCGLLTKK
jgi:hypothetical protein